MNWRFAPALIVAVAGLAIATQFIAQVFEHQAVLGTTFLTFGEMRVYPPWSILEWDARWERGYPRPFAVSRLIVFLTAGAGVALVASALHKARVVKAFGRDAWGKLVSVRKDRNCPRRLR
ncbi:MAG: Type IV secretory pathway, VirD4 component [Alphaproteobacteria bacterium]|nr:MAG: Type IV secretory pathway, VirD4 component [Alphaproteobacteria bacterium]